MTDQSQLFDKDTTSGEGTSGAQASDQQSANPDQGKIQPGLADMNAVYADQLAAIAGEDGQPKYKDVSTALHALKASQEFIETLKTENSQFKVGADETETLKGIVESFKNSQSSEGNDQLPQGLNAEEVQDLVSNTIAQQQASKISSENQQFVVKALEKMYGEKAEELFVNKAKELGLPVSELDNLSAMSPTAVLKYFETEKKLGTDKNINSSTNTEAFSQRQQEPERKNIMNGASTEDMLQAWRTSAAKVEQTT